MASTAFVVRAVPLLCMAALGLIFANAVVHHLGGVARFVWVLKEWGFESLSVRRVLARAIIVFELLAVASIVFAVATGLTDSRRLGPPAWLAGRAAMVGLLFFLQLAIFLYAASEPLLCGCGPLTERLDGWLQQIWLSMGFARPEGGNAIPIMRNVLLSLAAVVGLLRPRVRSHE